MKKMKSITITTALTLLTIPTYSIELSETQLVEWAKKESFNSKQLALDSLSKKKDLAAFNDQFSFSADVATSYSKTDETSFSPNMPITTPTKNAELKITKPTKYGVAASVSTYTNQISNSFFQKGTTSAVGAEVSVDLYKDIMGRITRTQEDSLTLKSQIAEKEKAITTHAFVQEVRKLYWKLVANNESLLIAKGLLKTAKRLEADTVKRLKNNIADRGEVARARSQVEARNGQIYLLEFERSQLIQGIRELFPEQIKDNNVTLAKYNLDNTVNNVLKCTAKISSRPDIPKDFTLYDDVLILLREDLAAAKKVNSAYSMADLKLVSDVKYIGKDFGYSDSIDELKEDGRKAYSVALQLTIPLGKAKKRTEDIQDELIQKQNISKYQEIEGKIAAYHVQTMKSVTILNNVIAAQNRNSGFLSETLKDSNKKFRQARLAARDLIQDEDSYLQNNLDTINTKYRVIEILINYFTVFTETPCEINQ